ncbi:methyltransferase domain-containing protein [Fulvivirgaceae bacterium PWU5]|uniref:Methyltransferase domain-containing protein n=1 Tax=Dawidia cretensis TaxID=2782350 RepID=A0AAP2GVJ7_9BACT|nr:class I SAM-dependent methyltransferase [Dawidia cretensis]MBT1710610.1 methyltransferase domain-containing protein [Dawidia cretensis]
MTSKTQKEAFLHYEADNYFNRNRGVSYVPEKDVVINLLKEYNYTPQRVLEIGCNTGYRLEAIRSQFGSFVAGIEPSQEAIDKGKQQYPEVQFVRGTADDLSTFSNGTFDLIVIGFVLYVVDREMLLKSIAETDRVLKDGGSLMIIDFFTERPVRNAYQHIQEMEAYAYKQNYDEIFTATQMYQLLDKRSLSHINKSYDATGDYYNKYSITTLRKDLQAAYK